MGNGVYLILMKQLREYQFENKRFSFFLKNVYKRRQK